MNSAFLNLLNKGRSGRLLLVLFFLLSTLQAKALTGLQKVSCIASDLTTPVWVREYSVVLEDPYQNLFVAQSLLRENGCSLGLKNTVYLHECRTVRYE